METFQRNRIHFKVSITICNIIQRIRYNARYSSSVAIKSVFQDISYIAHKIMSVYSDLFDNWWNFCVSLSWYLLKIIVIGLIWNEHVCI